MTNNHSQYRHGLWCAFLFLVTPLQAEVFYPLVSTPGHLALSGGGAAGWTGVGELPYQPSNIQISGGHQIHLGFANMTNGLNPSFMYGRKASRLASFGIGGFRAKQRDYRQVFSNVTGGFSLFFGPFFTVGASFSSMMLEVEKDMFFGVDMSVGIHYKLYPWLWLAGNVENVNESDLSYDEKVWQTRRHYNFGTQIKPLSFFKTFYDVSMYTFESDGISHILGFSLARGVNEEISISASIKSNSRLSRLHAGIGVVFKALLNKSLYGFRYSMGEIPITNSDVDIRHAFAVQVEFNLLTDYEPPIISVKDEIGVITPSAGPDSELVYFKIFTEDKQSAINYWLLSICTMNEEGKAVEVIKSFTGKGIPPKVISWRGRDSRGLLLKSGFYTYRLIVEDESGNRAMTNWQMIEIRE